MMRWGLIVLSLAACSPAVDASSATYTAAPPVAHVQALQAIGLAASQTVVWMEVCSSLPVGVVTVSPSAGVLVGPAQMALSPVSPGDCTPMDRSAASFVWVGSSDEVLWTVAGDALANTLLAMPGIVQGVNVRWTPPLWFAIPDAGFASLVPVTLTARTLDGGYPEGVGFPDASITVQSVPGIVLGTPPNTDQSGQTAFTILLANGTQSVPVSILVDGRLSTLVTLPGPPVADAGVGMDGG